MEKPGKGKQSKVTRIEVRTGGGLHGSEKPGWSTGGMKRSPETKNLQ